ncbi:MAG: hypothetical protein JRH20_10675 [Deltaproteobacteria bacterium]|nr:hypothetical protein [Deltaproteobacteria bacterium]
MMDGTIQQRSPLMGYNHNLKYSGREYHVQTEDSGVNAPHVITHLFCSGTILATKRSDYADLVADPEHVDGVRTMMKIQHKAVIRELVRGALDEKIVQYLGSLRPKTERERVRRYRHKLLHKTRVYSLETSFYTTIVSEIFWEGVLIDCCRQDLSEELLPNSPEMEARAQLQHKEMLRRLKNGQLDEKIIGFLGTLELPPEREFGVVGADEEHRVHALAQIISGEHRIPAQLRAPLQAATGDVYQHRLRHRDETFNLMTKVFYGEDPHAVTELIFGQTLVSSQRTENENVGELRKDAREQHKTLMRQLRDGEMDETLDLLDEILD